MTIDGVDITDYGFHVIKTSGDMDFLGRKKIDEFNFLDKNGEEHFTTEDDIIFGTREIKLECACIGGLHDLYSKAAALLAVLEADGIKTLVLASGVSHDCYYIGGNAFVRQGKRIHDPSVGMITLTFREPEPVDGIIPVTEYLPGTCTDNDKWIIDGHDLLSTFNVVVAGIKGNSDFRERKLFPEILNLNRSGENSDPNTGNLFFKGRDITLSCFLVRHEQGITGEEFETDFLNDLTQLKTMIYQPGLRSLKVPYESTVYKVYLEKHCPVEMVTKWTVTPLVCKFDLKFREP